MFQFKAPKDALAGMVPLGSHQESYLITSENRIMRFSVDEKTLLDVEATDNRLFKLNSGEKIVGIRDQLLIHYP
ncbi:MAG: hypothetical protein SWJ54_18990 [Cyanobacteriota bacterium]|nr:hypothetical protein [Cyanobacteriota bacterium]